MEVKLEISYQLPDLPPLPPSRYLVDEGMPPNIRYESAYSSAQMHEYAKYYARMVVEAITPGSKLLDTYVMKAHKVK